LRATGENGRAAALDEQAGTLSTRFNEDFWSANDGCYALAIGGDGRVAQSVTSNAGHALWGGIAEHEKGRLTAERLLRSDLFSGWGIRTLSSDSPRFNPLGYHLGTVWPHDNSIVVMGFKRYGLPDLVSAGATALFDAARMFPYYRLPELFGGASRSSHQVPVPYPVACRPQAWAAGSFLLITQAMLGLCPDAANNRLYIVDPRLPEFLQRVRVSNLRVGNSTVDLLYLRRGKGTWVRTTRVDGDLQVEGVREWPSHLL
jgi:glycogen debranching enzyme